MPTTTLAFVINEGIIVAADSRVTTKMPDGTSLPTGSVNKIVEINRYMLATMAGDCSHNLDGVVNLNRELEKRGKRVSAAKAARLLKDELSSAGTSKKGEKSYAEVIIAGWEEKRDERAGATFQGCASLYYVNSEQVVSEGNIFSTGSGSKFADAVLGDGYHSDISMNEATELAKRSIRHAIENDSATGGPVTVYHIGPGGWRKLWFGNIPDHYDNDQEMADVNEDEDEAVPMEFRRGRS